MMIMMLLLRFQPVPAARINVEKKYEEENEKSVDEEELQILEQHPCTHDNEN